MISLVRLFICFDRKVYLWRLNNFTLKIWLNKSFSKVPYSRFFVGPCDQWENQATTYTNLNCRNKSLPNIMKRDTCFEFSYLNANLKCNPLNHFALNRLKINIYVLKNGSWHLIIYCDIFVSVLTVLNKDK